MRWSPALPMGTASERGEGGIWTQEVGVGVVKPPRRQQGSNVS